MKERKLLFTYHDDKKAAFSIEDDRLAQVFLSGKTEFNVGDIFVGRVKNIVRGMNAAFVEFSQGIAGFLSYKDLKPEAVLNRKDATQLKCGDELMVQISKEPLKTKEAALTTDLSVSGKYLVIFPFGKGIHYSNKLSDIERQKLVENISVFLTETDAGKRGYIFRTNASNASMEELKCELDELTCKIDEMLSVADKRTVFSNLYKEKEFFDNVLKNIYCADNTEVITDKKEIYDQVRSAGFPVRFYEDDRINMFRLYGLEERLSEAVSRKVWLKSGGYLVIEPTEAMTVIDVNTGKNVDKKTPEETYFKTNIEAAGEIAAQLRLRNLSGIIIVDFIDMESDENNEELLRFFRSCLNADPVKTTLVDMTALGLVEITRKKVKRPLYEQLKNL